MADGGAGFESCYVATRIRQVPIVQTINAPVLQLQLQGGTSGGRQLAWFSITPYHHMDLLLNPERTSQEPLGISAVAKYTSVPSTSDFTCCTCVR